MMAFRDMNITLPLDGSNMDESLVSPLSYGHERTDLYTGPKGGTTSVFTGAEGGTTSISTGAEGITTSVSTGAEDGTTSVSTGAEGSTTSVCNDIQRLILQSAEDDQSTPISAEGGNDLVSTDSQRPWVDRNQDKSCEDDVEKLDKEKLDKEKRDKEKRDKEKRDKGPKSELQDANCLDNPGHKDFIHMDGLNRKHHLPNEYQGQETWHLMGLAATRTVKLIMIRTTASRPLKYPGTQKTYPYRKDYKTSNMRVGTGFILNSSIIDGPVCPCRCKTCESKPVTRYLEIWICTGLHVIYNNEEAAFAMAQFSFASQNEEEITLREQISLYGIGDVNNVYSDCHTDRSIVKFVCHNKWLMDNLPSSTQLDIPSLLTQTSPFGFIVSHPYGKEKHISLGQFLYLEVNLSFDISVERWYDFDKEDKYRILITSLSRNDKTGKHGQEQALSETSYKFKRGQKIIFKCFYSDGERNWWATFPENTEFKNGNETVKFPTETEFYVKMLVDRIENRDVSQSRIVYNMAALPGTSGALVIILHKIIMLFYPISHHGPVRSGENVSGLLRRDNSNMREFARGDGNNNNSNSAVRLRQKSPLSLVFEQDVDNHDET